LRLCLGYNDPEMGLLDPKRLITERFLDFGLFSPRIVPLYAVYQFQCLFLRCRIPPGALE